MSQGTLGALFAAARSVVYVSAFFALWVWLALSLRRFDARFTVAWPEWTGAAAVAVMALGAALGFSCVVLFVTRGRGTPALFDPPREFVAAGPYRYVRNPMYLGGLTLLAGFGLWLRSPSILLLVPVAWVLVHLVVLFHEEPSLEAKFGDGYRRYKRSVDRWMPRLRPR